MKKENSTTESNINYKVEESHILHQPKEVWVIAFACVIAFMGLGLVDPILKEIGEQLKASPSQVSMLMTSYLFVTGIAMVFTSWISSRLGVKKTLILGLGLIVIFAAAGGLSDTVAQISWFRGGWGLGNALFIATALSAIISLSPGTDANAIILYECAMGLGLSVGPLLGGLLGSVSWRGPFFGVAVLMLIALVAILIFIQKLEVQKERISFAAPFKALAVKPLLIYSIATLLYSFGIFTLLGYTPFVLGLHKIMQIAMVFFGWGILVALSSVFIAPLLELKFDSVKVLYIVFACIAVVMLFSGIYIDNKPILIGLTIFLGVFMGINNTVMTTCVMECCELPRPIISATYSFIRFTCGAAIPVLAGFLSEKFLSPQLPFYVAFVFIMIGAFLLFGARKLLKHQVHF